jgi:hypothetical protein
MTDQEDRSFRPEDADGPLARVDPARLGQRDTPEEDWGEALEGEARHGARHLIRDVRPEPRLGHGAKTRAAIKDIVSRRT